MVVLMTLTQRFALLDYDRRSHVEDFCHHPIEQDADGLWSCNGTKCARDFETRRECENACLAKYLESEAA